MARRLKMPAETVVVPRDMTEANIVLARIGDLVRRRDLIQLAHDEGVAALKATSETEAAPIDAEIVQRQRALQIWAEANRDALTGGGRTKTVKLPAGEVLWRARPPSVTLRGVAAVIQALSLAGLQRFLRTKTEVDKEAILREPAAVVGVPGISVGSEGEEFVVQPATMALSGSAVA